MKAALKKRVELQHFLLRTNKPMSFIIELKKLCKKYDKEWYFDWTYQKPKKDILGNVK